MNDPQQRAVVLGGSVAGLLAARVLAARGYQALVVERNGAIGSVPRRGVPQGRHAHGLLAAGQQALERLLPGFTDELAADPAVAVGDISGRMRWYVDGHRMVPEWTGLLIVGAARPVIEAHIRARVAAEPGVVLLEDTDVVAPVFSADHRRVTGVRVHGRTTGGEEVLAADLVVDATGRGSRTPRWLRDAGYGEVPEERVEMDLAYTSRRYRLRTDPFVHEQSYNVVATPTHPRGAFFHTLGGHDGHGGHDALVSLTSLHGDHPGTDPQGFDAFVRSLPVPEIHRALEGAEPLDEPTAFRFPAGVRRRYERLDRFPAGLVLVGDALSSFNPVYGQGMSVAALGAETLGRHVEQAGGLEDVAPSTYLADVARLIDAPWDIATGGDLAFPRTRGRRTLATRLVNGYMARVQAAATVDARVTTAFMRVAGLVDPPTALMRPATMVRVLRGARAARTVRTARIAAAPSPDRAGTETGRR